MRPSARPSTVSRARPAPSGAPPGRDLGIVGLRLPPWRRSRRSPTRTRRTRRGRSPTPRSPTGSRRRPRSADRLSPSRSTRTMASSTNWATSGIWRGRMPISPTVVRVNRNVASPDQIFRSTATISTFKLAMPQHLSTQPCSRPLGITAWRRGSRPSWPGRRARRSGRTPVRARGRTRPWSGGRTPRSVSFSGHRRTGLAGELLGRHHVLRQEPLDAPGALDELLVLFGQLVDTEDGDDVLKVLVALQDSDDFLSHAVVLVTDDTRVEDGRARGQRVHRREDALGEHRCGRARWWRPGARTSSPAPGRCSRRRARRPPAST